MNANKMLITATENGGLIAVNSPLDEQTAEPEQNNTTAAQLTALAQKAVEIAQRYEKLSRQDRIDVIAQAFGCTTGKIETSPCTGKWRGTSDMSIKFDNGTSLFIGNHSTPKTKTAKVQNEFVNSALVQYNPEIISVTKETAVAALMQREAKDNAIAAQKGLKPYTFLNVEFNDGSDDLSSGHKGWYFVTLAVDGKIRAHIETGLNHDIASGKVRENITRDNYFAAGALKDTDVDYVFNNVGFSSTAELCSLHISDDVRERAEKALAERVAADIPDKQAIGQQTEPTTTAPYYPINETAARRAKDANSFYDYKPGSATAEYRHYVDEAVELAARQKKRVDPMYHEKIDSLLDTYAKKLAENMNKGYEIAGRVPSILIAGGSNFPTRKKEKQNAATDRNMEEYREIQGLLDKIRSTGMGGISADDPQAVQKLQSKLADLEKSQETMKAVNAYYRKHKTLDGCPHLSPEQIAKLKASMENGYHLEGKPYPTWALSNNSTEIRRVKELYAKAQEQPKAQEQTTEPEQPTQEAEPDKDTFTIYQLKGGDETRDFRFEPYDRLQAAGLAVDPANYANIYTAPLTPDMTLESIFERFNIDHAKDFKGHSLSISDVVVLHQNGQDTAHYIDSGAGFRQVPEFLQEQKQLIPDDYKTGEKISTPRGTFSLTDMTHEQMNEAGYSFHHQSDGGKYHIMANGIQAFAIAAEQPRKINLLKHVEDVVEQNDNNFDGVINKTPTVDELEAKVKAGGADFLN